MPHVTVTPNEDLTCPGCGKAIVSITDIEFVDNSFDYAGTHCTGGRSGTHDPGSTIECVACGCDEFTMDDFDVDEDYGYDC